MNIVHKLKAIGTIVACSIAFSSFGQTGKFKVTLDAGHGAHDYGAVYNGHIEKNITLAIVLKVGKILEGNQHISVNYTRKTDLFIELVERSSIANRANANIFVSIHCNANNNPDADGTETYVMGLNKNASNLAVAKSENAVITLEKDYKQKYEGFDPNNPSSLIGINILQEEYLDNSITLASKIQDQFSGIRRKSRGVKQAPFMVLHKAYMPRVLIETGFISNGREGSFLDSEEGQMEIAETIAAAIVSYKNEYYGNDAIEATADKPSNKMVEKPYKDTSTIKTESIVKPVVDKPIVSKPVETRPVEIKPEPKADTSGVIFKVQITAVSKPMEMTPSNFRGLSNISDISDGGKLFKYAYGSTTDYNVAKQNLEEAKAKGFTGAYLIAYKDGRKINVQDAIK